MSHFACIVQEDSTAHERRSVLEDRLRSHAAANGLAGEPTFSWTVAADGFMFTEAKQSTSSIVSCHIPGPTTYTEREAFMRAVCTLWGEETGSTDHEIVVTITETGPEA